MPTYKEVIVDAIRKYRRQQDVINSNTFVAQVEGKGLSTYDFDDSAKEKLDGIEDYAEVNVIEQIKLNDEVLPNDSGTVTVTIDVSNVVFSDKNIATDEEVKELLDDILGTR